MSMKQGFTTVATGDERYYVMARNLLRSYRQNCEEPKPFAIIADRHNVYTEEFDDVVILEKPTRTWMDKLEILRNSPYDENIFIDADCLIYKDINFMWDVYKEADDFSCFGEALPMDSTTGWFTKEVNNVYPIHFITHLHGISYFLRVGGVEQEMWKICQDIIHKYEKVTFSGFNDVLADEPIFALAMAVLNLKPVKREPQFYCFVPFATNIETNYYTRSVKFSNPKDGVVDGCYIVHWGNQNTLKSQYRFDAHIINHAQGKNRIMDELLYNKKWLLYFYRLQDIVERRKRWCLWIVKRARLKIKSIMKRYKV